LNEATLHATALAWAQQGVPAVLVQVVSHQGSVPRETGTRMLVAAHQVLGTIGGGHLELQAIAQARAFLTAGVGAGAPALARPHQERIALGPSLGQCCGGVLTLQFSAFTSAEAAAWPAPTALFHLQLFGAGHIGRAIVRLLVDLPCQVQWVDEREAEFPTDPQPAHIQRVCSDTPAAEVASAPPGACYLVMTHSHDLDLAITRAVLARGDFAYLGLIGSKTKRARFEHRLLERGVPPALLQRMVCPIGVPGISGKEPAVLALAVVAQLLQVAQPAAVKLS
jgi:xanthine dehydrogenase accessory factor